MTTRFYVGKFENDVFRAQVHVGRDGQGGIENARQLAAKEGWGVARARRALKLGEESGRLFLNLGTGVWQWTPEFSQA